MHIDRRGQVDQLVHDWRVPVYLNSFSRETLVSLWDVVLMTDPRMYLTHPASIPNILCSDGQAIPIPKVTLLSTTLANVHRKKQLITWSYPLSFRWPDGEVYNTTCQSKNGFSREHISSYSWIFHWTTKFKRNCACNSFLLWNIIDIFSVNTGMCEVHRANENRTFKGKITALWQTNVRKV